MRVKKWYRFSFLDELTSPIYKLYVYINYVSFSVLYLDREIPQKDFWQLQLQGFLENYILHFHGMGSLKMVMQRMVAFIPNGLCK